MAGEHDRRDAASAPGAARHHAWYAPGASESMMAAVGLYRPSPAEFADVHAIASDLIDSPLASLEEIRRVDALTGAAIWVMRRDGAVSGFLATLALTEGGRDALAASRFSARTIQQEWVAPLGDPLAGFYCWCFAGRDRATRAGLLLALRTLLDVHFPDLPFYGREATPAGARSMERLGFQPVDTVPHLYWRACRALEKAS